MKTLFKIPQCYIVVFLLLFQFFTCYYRSFAQMKGSDEKQFAVILRTAELNNANISLYEGNDLLEDMDFKTPGGAEFRMDWNFDNYIFEITKRGYTPQKIKVNAVVPDGFDRKAAGSFDAGSVLLYNEIEGMELEFYEKPIASIKYDASQNRFVYEYDYRNDLPAAIEEYKTNEKKYEETIKKALAYFKNKEYENALAQYEIASELKPNENLPKEKIKEIQGIIEASKMETTQAPAKEDKESITETADHTEIQQEEKEMVPDEQQATASIEEDLKKLENLKDQEKPHETAELLETIGNKYYARENLNSALVYYNQSLQLKKELKDLKGTSDVLNNIAMVEFDSGRYEVSIKDFNESLLILRNLKDKPAMVKVLQNLGEVYESTYRYLNALNSYKEAFDITTELGEEEKTAEILSAMGGIHFKNGNYEEAVNKFRLSLDKDKKLGKNALVSNTLNNIGIAYYNWGKLDKAVESYEESMKIASKLGNDRDVSVTLNNLGNINYDWEKYTSALDYYERSLAIKENLNYQRGIALSLYNIGNVHKNLEEFETALSYYEKSYQIGKDIQYDELILKNYQSFSAVYVLLGDFEKALDYYKLYTETRFSLTEIEKKDQLNEMLERYEVEKTKSEKEIKELKSELLRQKLLSKIESDRLAKEMKIKDLEIKQKEQEVKNQRRLTIIFLVGFILLLGLVIMLIRLIKQKTAANKLLAAQRDQISAQKKEITDSIKYAERIQSALLPDASAFGKLREHFIFFRPKDIVSGDFYWTAEKDDKIIVTAVDCTGHGVPGAFMSMLGISYLNEIVSSKQNLTASEILNQLRKMVIQSLHQSLEKEGARDGMDMALCIIDFKKYEVEYAGAFNPLYHVKNKELTIHKADKMPIGIHALIEDKTFKQHTITVEKGDCLYMFSDGYMDQFSGDDGKKFMSRRFKELLVGNSDKTMKEQKEILAKTFDDWKKQSDQIDDVLVIGIKI